MAAWRQTRRSFLAAAAALFALGCAPKPPAQALPQSAAAVAMPDHYSAEVAANVLADGGNAVDAAIAAAFVLAVTWPEAGNIGGGGFMLAHMDGKAVFLDFREAAPAAATRDMYLDAKGEVIEGASFTGHRAIGVPGTVAGLWAAHRKYGTKPWADLLSTAIALAEMGFMVPAQLEGNLRDELPRVAGTTNLARYFGGLHAGDMFRQPELAATLRRIAAAGADGFYRGETARLLVDEMRRGGGLITAGDLEGYRPVWRAPLHARWRQFEILGAPPPSSGGFAIIQLLKMKDALAARFAGLPLNSPQYIHLTAEMEKRVFADRAEYLGDPDFVPQRVTELIADDYVARRAAEVNPKSITPAGSVRPGLEPHANDAFLDRGSIGQRGRPHLHAQRIFRQRRRGRRRRLRAQQRDGRLQRQAGRAELLWSRWLGRQCHPARETDAVVHGADDPGLRRQGQHGARLAGWLDDHHDGLPDDRRRARLPHVGGGSRRRDAIPSPALARGPDHLQHQQAAAE